MKKAMKKIVVLAVTLATALSSCMPAFAETTNFIQDTEGEMIPIPETYSVQKAIKNLGSYGTLKNPEDIFYDSNKGYLYVADAGNHRVLKMTTTGEVLLEVTEAADLPLSEPMGVYVDEEENIWIADKGNQRVVVVDRKGKLVQEMYKPESEALEKESYDIEKIVVNKMGYLFALKGANILKINSKNEFLTYMGTPPVGFSFTRFLIRKFGSPEQREKTERVEPTAYNNITIGLDGHMYGVLSDGTSGQIRRLNSVGENTYPELAYGFTFYKQGELIPTTPAFRDITVDVNGIVTTLDQQTGLIYQYDPEGNLLTTFGGLGNRNGMFNAPKSIVVDEDGSLYVLDYGANSIQVFKPTAFIELVHEAIILQAGGYYDEAKAYWTDVLNIDSNYALAHKCIGKILYKEGKFEDSKNHYKLANDKEGYSKSFGEQRHNILRDYFFWIVAIVVVIAVVIIKTFVAIKRNCDKWAFNIEMRGDMDR